MKNKFIPIGKMAQINHVTIATLRLYDEKNLLKPRYVDPQSGYRYYDVQQNAILDMIAYMKELDMNLVEIKEVLDSKDITLIESILAKKNDQIHKEIKELKIKHEAIERSIKTIEYYRRSPASGIPNLQFIDQRYIYSIKCLRNFYENSIEEYEESLTNLKNNLLDSGFSYIHTYNVGTSIKKDNYNNLQFIADEIFIFVENQQYKNRNDIKIIESGMYACIYADDYDDEERCAKTLKKYCDDNNYVICGDYICEVITEFAVFGNEKRNMFLRLQVPIKF